MPFSDRIDRWHFRARQYRWLHFFAVFNRVALAAGFLPAGAVKIMGERFTDLTVSHPLGHYLFALYRTGSYYTFIGVLQVLAAILLLIPRTALLGALIYLPIILNILVLSVAVRFQGSLLTAPLMLLANLYLLCWDYHKLRLIFPWNYRRDAQLLPAAKTLTYRLPWRFGAGVVATVFAVAFGVFYVLNSVLMPFNRQPACEAACDKRPDPVACRSFCGCIHQDGRALNDCLREYEATSN